MQSDTHGKVRTSRLTHYILQNIGVILAFSIFFLVLLTFLTVFFLEQNRFPGNFELTSTINTTMPLVFSAVGQGFVILTRGIDLSVGGIIDLSNAIAAVTMNKTLPGAFGWSLFVLFIGGVCGLINGLFVAVGRLQPIVVTLATLSIFQGIAVRVLPQPGGAIPPGYTNILVNPNYPFSFIYIILLALAWFAFRRLRIGVNLYAVGNDEQAARAQKIDVLKTKIIAYVLSGVLASAAGLFLAASATAGDANTGNSFTLSSIVAAVIGGVSLFGGRGSGIGAIVGAFIVTLIVNILFFGHVNPLYQPFYEGLFLLFAVLLGVFISRVIRRRH